jgi:hypothetical protein
LPDIEREAGYEVLNLRSGSFLSLPKSEEEAEGEESAIHWIAKQPVDLMARWAPENGEEIHLGCIETRLADIENKSWATATPEDCAKALESETNLRKWDAGTEKELLAELGVQVYILPPASQLPRTFAFQTRDGTTGLMQITGYADNPRGVQIRYQLAPHAGATINVSLSAKGEIVIDGEPCPREQLQERIRTLAAIGVDSVLIQADKKAPYSKVVELIEMCKKCGLDKIRLK